MEHVLEPSIWLIDESLNNLSLTDDPDPEIIAHQNLISQFRAILKDSPFYYISWHRQKKPWNERSTKNINEALDDLFTAKSLSKKKILAAQLSLSRPLEFLTDFFSDAFIQIQLGKHGWSNRVTRCIRGALQLADVFIKQGLSQLYLPGVQYLQRWMHLHLLILKGKLPKGPAGSFQFYDAIKEFNQLSDKSKALVLGANSYYLASMKKFDNYAKAESIEIMRMIIPLDPLSFHWHYTFGNWLRFSRRRVEGNFNPFVEEIQILWETYENCDYVKYEPDGRNSRLRNVALSAICQCLAEIIKFRIRRGIRISDYPPLYFGNLIFHSEQEAVDFVLEGIKGVMSEHADPCFGELIRSAEILCNILPERYRDYTSAEKYYKAAYKIKPNKTKINHKLGLFYLTSPNHFDMVISLKYLRTAFEVDNSSFPAALDLIKTLISSPKEHKLEIEAHLFLALAQPTFMDKNKAQVLSIKGFFKFMLGEKDVAIDCWIQAQPDHPYGSAFSELPASIKRHKWDPNSVKVDAIKTALLDKYFKQYPINEASIKDKLKDLIHFISLVRMPGQRAYR